LIGSTNSLGQMLGNYRLYEPIGTGGMATVYRGEQLTIQRTVAIKVLSSALAGDEEFVTRFRREAETAARLEHPHIVPVYDFGAVGGVLYVVMRYLPGGTLAQRLKRFGLPSLADTADLLNQIASALDYAHKNGVVHRDIKPANILLDEDGRAYLADFGIARLLNTAGTTITTGIGTPAYMAPEQFTGGTIEPRTDIYALGVMLYVMTVGKLPFESDSQLGVAYQHINTSPAPPIEESPALPVGVSDAIVKALAKAPGDRPPTAGSLAAAFSEATAALQSEQGARTTYFVRPLPLTSPPTLSSSAPPSSDRGGTPPTSLLPEGDNVLLVDTRPSKPARPVRVPILAGLLLLVCLGGLAGVLLLSSLTTTSVGATHTASATSGPTQTPTVTLVPTADASTETLLPTATPPATAAPEDTATVTPTLALITGQCPGFLPSRLIVGQPARVIAGGAPNRLRSEPNMGGEILGQIPPSATFDVLEGPRCTPDATAWWRVDYKGQVGWTAEGQGDVYYLELIPSTP
jgi:serine/threonine protein kinase